MLILTMPSPLIRCQPTRNFLVTAFLLAASHTIPIDSPAQKPALVQPAVANYLKTQPGVEYVRDQVCGSCHSFEYKTFKQTAIGRSTSVPSEQDLKSLSKPVTFSNTALNRTYSVYAQDGKMFPPGIGARCQWPACIFRLPRNCLRSWCGRNWQIRTQFAYAATCLEIICR